MSDSYAKNILTGRVVPVLMGGPGREREVSLRSGAAVSNALRSLGAEAPEIDVTDTGFSLPAGTFLAFNMIHGTFGEDGQIQEELEKRGVPYTGEGVEESRTAFDKILTKKKFRTAGVPSVASEVLYSRNETPNMGVPCVVKAPRQGSSVGVHLVHTADELKPALEDCFSLDTEVMVEELFSGRELTVGILGHGALPVVEIVPRGGFYDYEHKYTKGGSDYYVPARIPEETGQLVRETAVAACCALGLQVYSRVDIMLAEDGSLNVLEINTIPGMTETSLLPKAAAEAGMSFASLCLRIAELSIKRFTTSE
jgi:D-alanine-D-alanine ligase